MVKIISLVIAIIKTKVMDSSIMIKTNFILVIVIIKTKVVDLSIMIKTNLILVIDKAHDYITSFNANFIRFWSKLNYVS